MCGIAGFLGPDQINAEASLEKMLSMLKHRGPDDIGCWHDRDAGLSLGHRRLAILDLSPAGHQPMTSACGRYILAFNGEIYNWQELKEELEKTGKVSSWRGSSDTEVLLSAISLWGLEPTLLRARGMFALALWDRLSRRLRLVRDRIGEKPIYYGRVKGRFLFSSELKSIHSVIAEDIEVDSSALALLLRYGYIPGSLSIYKGISKLTPGSLIEVDPDGTFGSPKIWWSFKHEIERNSSQPEFRNDEDAVNELSDVLGAAIEEQVVADVPVGAFLSGGIDSSTVVALMQSRLSKKVRTFTIGFSEAEYDEARHAKRIAEYLGTDHIELTVSPEDALNVIPKLPEIYDEPFADASQIPTYLLSNLTKKHVTVCLSGDGADELFGGYNRYIWVKRIGSLLALMPSSVRRSFSKGLTQIPASSINSMAAAIEGFIPAHLKLNNTGDKLHKLGSVMGANSSEELFSQITSQWHGQLPLNQRHEPSTIISNTDLWPKGLSFSEQMMAVDAVSYLPDDILVKVDRAAMASSLETRLPFLDANVVDFSSKLHFKQKVRGGEGKWILRQLLSRHVPEELWRRPKQGFAIPIEHWLRGPLREWAEDLLSEASLASDGHLDPRPIRNLWQQHLKGQNKQYAIWNVLSYMSWSRKWR